MRSKQSIHRNLIATSAIRFSVTITIKINTIRLSVIIKIIHSSSTIILRILVGIIVGIMMIIITITINITLAIIISIVAIIFIIIINFDKYRPFHNFLIYRHNSQYHTASHNHNVNLHHIIYFSFPS